MGAASPRCQPVLMPAPRSARPTPTTLSFSSLGAFLAADPERSRSEEVDFGRPWRTVEFGPAYRAAWLPATGELFTVRLGSIPSGGGRVDLVAQVRDGRMLAELLSGWQGVVGGFDSIRWLRSRLAKAHPLKRRDRLSLAA
jgi:hypothetical protein